MVFSVKNILGRGQGFAGLGGGVGGGGYPRALSKGILMTANVTTPVTYVRVGSYTIPAQQVIHLGSGRAGHQGANYEEIGKLQLHMHDDTATNSVEEAGYFKVGQTNANETLFKYYYEDRSENLGGGAATANLARNLQVPMAEVMNAPAVITREDSKVVVDFKGDAADISVAAAIGTAATFDNWNVPITVYQ